MVILTIKEYVNVIPHNHCPQKRAMKTGIRNSYILVI